MHFQHVLDVWRTVEYCAIGVSLLFIPVTAHRAEGHSGEDGSNDVDVILSLASKDVRVGDHPMVEVEVTAPKDRDLRIIKFGLTQLPYTRSGAILYGPDGEPLPRGLPRIPPPSRLKDEDAIIVKAGTTVRGRIRTFVMPRKPGEHKMYFEYSPTFSPAKYVYKTFRFRVVEKANDNR